MGWLVSIGGCHIETREGFKSVPSEIIKSEGLAADYVLGPGKSFFKAKQALEERFKGVTNVEYTSKTEGLVKEYPYTRFFEIFEYSDPEFDNQMESWEFAKNNPGKW